MKVAFVYMNTENNVGRGAGYVAGAVVRAGYDLEFFDTQVIPIENIAKKVISDNFSILMISSMTLMFPEALNLIRLIKLQKNIPTLVGGVHSAIIGEKLLEQHEELDYLCIGEGESMVVDFLDHFGKSSLYEVKNLAYRKNGLIYSNSLRPAEDLSKLPPFPWYFFKTTAIVQDDGFCYVSATRGCPYNCTYCSNGIYLKKYGKSYLRSRPVEHVIEELKYLNETYSPRLFYFSDEMILTNIDYAIELFEAVKKELNMPYGCMARVEHITPEIVDILVRTGCKYIGMGVECGNEEFRKQYLNRHMSNQQIEDAFNIVKKAGIFATSFNMIGYPFENDDFLVDETIKLNKKLSPDYVQVSIFYPFPGSKLYQHCIEKDLIDTEKMANTMNYYNHSILKGVSIKNKKLEIDLLFNPYQYGKLKKRLFLIYQYICDKPFISAIVRKSTVLKYCKNLLK